MELSKRRTLSPEFKARVAMEAISGCKTIQEIAADHAIHPIQVSQWKRRLLNGQVSASPSILRRVLNSLRPACRRSSSGFAPAAAPGLLFGGNGTSACLGRWARAPAATPWPTSPAPLLQ